MGTRPKSKASKPVRFTGQRKASRVVKGAANDKGVLMLPQTGSGRVRGFSRGHGRTPVAALLLVVALSLVACGGPAAGGEEAGYGTSSVHEQGDNPGTGRAVSSASWIGPLVRLNGTIYVLSKEPPVEPDRLGEFVARGKRRLDVETGVWDGDSNFLPEGTRINAIQGLSVAEAVVARYQDRYVVLKPNLSPGGIGTVKETSWNEPGAGTAAGLSALARDHAAGLGRPEPGCRSPGMAVDGRPCL